jgi:hypothetical protein
MSKSQLLVFYRAQRYITVTGHITDWSIAGYFEVSHEVCKLSLRGLKI